MTSIVYLLASVFLFGMAVGDNGSIRRISLQEWFLIVFWVVIPFGLIYRWNRRRIERSRPTLRTPKNGGR